MAETRRPRGRPQGGSAVDRSDIAEAALKAIAAGGYSGLSMRAVGRAAGVSLATVQRHYGTKEELWRGAVDHYLEGVVDPELSDTETLLQSAIEYFLGFSSAYPGLLPTVFSDQAQGHEERHGYIADRLADRHDRMVAMVAELQDSDAVRAVDGRAFLLLLNIGIGAIASTPGATRRIYGFDLEDPAERARLAAALADILRFGVGSR